MKFYFKESDGLIDCQLVQNKMKEIKELKDESEALSLAYDILYDTVKEECGDDLIRLDMELSKVESFIKHLAVSIGGKEHYHELLKRIGVKTILD